MMARTCGNLLAYALALASALALEDARPLHAQVPATAFSLNDMGNLAELSRPAMSPDGRNVAIVVSRVDWGADRLDGNLVLLNVATGNHRTVAHGLVSAPAWSPDGQRLAWLARDAAGTGQIHSAQAAGDDLDGRTLTHLAAGQGVLSFAWSPDGRSIAFLADDARRPDGEKAFDRSFDVSAGDYLGVSFLAKSLGGAPPRLWIVDDRASPPRLLAQDAGHLQNLAWLPDGRSIVVSAQPAGGAAAATGGAIFSFDVADGKRRTVVADHARIGSSGDLAVSSKGLIAYQHFRGGDPWTYPNNAAVIADGAPRDLTRALDRDIDDLIWMPDGHTMLVKAFDHLRAAVWSVAAGKETQRLELGAVSPISDLAVGGSGAIAFVGSEPHLPPELYIIPSAGARPLRLTRFNDFVAQRQLGTVSNILWRNDGLEHHGVVTLPPDYIAGMQAPLLVRIHGGPEWQATDAFAAESQLLAARGWIVFEPNYRGSNGQGERYQTAIIGDVVAGSGRDVLTGISAVRRAFSVNARRIAVDGYSWGGVLTSWLITRQNFCAAVPASMAIDFQDYYNESETGIWIKTILGSPYANGGMSRYDAQSPARYLGRVRTPTLIMHNVGDPNAPITQAYKLYHALHENGVKVRFVARDVVGHELPDPVSRRDFILRETAWLDENCPSS